MTRGHPKPPVWPPRASPRPAEAGAFISPSPDPQTIVVAFNGNAFTGIQSLLLDTNADVELAQKRTPVDVSDNEQVAALSRIGWTAHFDAAVAIAIVGDRRHASGGVAVFVRSPFATRRVADLAQTHPGRVLAVSAYLPHVAPQPVVFV